jgi:hypothetical protein
MVALGSITEWQPEDGSVTTWMASAAAREAAENAQRSELPPSYQRNQHLEAAREYRAMGKQLPRLMVVAWDIPGVCDIPVMTATINAHVRRHDAYHDWFNFEDGAFIRRTIGNPELIEFTPTAFGHMDAEQIRTHALSTTPETLDWDCFTFGIVQHTDYFTFYASVDHLHIDGTSAGLIFFDIHLTYQDLSRTSGRPTMASQVASYRSYAARQRDKVTSLNLSSPEIRDWIDFALDTGGDWPKFPLPVGDTWTTNKGDFVTVDLLDDIETESFDNACSAAGVRFSGGVLACAALADHELTGTETYHGFTPSDTRLAGIDSMTVGWFASLIPITVPTGICSFPAAARAAQKSFDDAKNLASVPLRRVLELADLEGLGIEAPSSQSMMVSFMDLRKIPLAALFEETHFGTYGDSLSHGGINLWINRHADKTTATISFPDNPMARESVHRYIAALSRAFARVNTTSDWVSAVAAHADSGHRIPVLSS